MGLLNLLMKDPLAFALVSIPLLFSVILHEVAHGWVAYKMGDPTAKWLGRLSLNPLKHLDPIGTLMLFLVGFGWAKPVPVSIGSLRRPKQDMVWVAAAGPGSNLLMAILWAIFLSVQRAIGLDEPFFQAMAIAGLQGNLVLMALNLLPVPPLDGGRIMVGLLPQRMSHQFARLEPYGLFIVILLLATGTLGVFLSPFLQFGRAIVGVFV